jgi:hypothetical protein
MVKGFVHIILLFVILLPGQLSAQELVVNGVYQGKNIFIQNPSIQEDNTYCIQAVYLNGLLVIQNPTTSAFEVDLSDLELNDEVNLKIFHNKSCLPKIINPQVIRPKDNFRFVDFSINESGISWEVEGEKEVIRYFIEKRINNKWIIVQSSNAVNRAGTVKYHVEVSHEAGDNQYRIKSILNGGKYLYSGIMTFVSSREPVSFYPERVTSKITLSRATDYEVLDVNGNLLAKGKEKEISVENLSPGLYYLVIENRTEKFIKK